jgi:hypothetical protein
MKKTYLTEAGDLAKQILDPPVSIEEASALILARLADAHETGRNEGTTEACDVMAAALKQIKPAPPAPDLWPT